MDKNFNIIISGGGTGGHLTPAFAIADAFKIEREDVNIRFIGSENGIESKLYKIRSEKYDLLKIVGLRRDFSLKGLLHNLIVFPFNFFHSFIKTCAIFSKFKPDIVIGTGGYSSAIPLFVAYLRGVKIFIQEQNSIPGLVNKIFLKKAEKVFFGFEPKEIKKINYIISGNPTKMTKNSVNKIVNKNQFTIFVIGGSQGSVPINNHFLKHYKKYVEKGIQLIWQCGDRNMKLIKTQVSSKFVELHGFINEIEDYYIKSDLIIARSGALTLSEISNYGKASILIPYPFAANNHQLFNAKLYEEKGASEIVEQHQLEEGVLERKVIEMIGDKNIIKNMEKNTSFLSKTNAAKNIINEILKICLIKVK